MSEQLKTITLASLVKQGEVTGISTLRYNSSNYPYITLLKGNKPNNVYFTLKTSEFISNHYSKGDNVMPVLKNAQIIQTESKQEGHEGETRFKLSTSEISNYVSTAELLSTFGMEEAQTDFDMNAFRAEFASAKEVLTPTV